MDSLRRGWFGVLAVGPLVLAQLGAAGAFGAGPAPGSTIEDGSDWVAQAYQNSTNGPDYTPQQSDTTGPQRAPFTTSSHRLVIGENTLQTELYRTNVYDGTPLSGITRLEYSTFARRAGSAPAGADRRPTYLRLNVDNDVDGVRDASLFFYPSNNAQQQPVANGVWQQWDVVGGRISVHGDAGPGATTTLEAYAAANPDSTLVNNDGLKPTGGALALINGGADGGATDSQVNGEYFVDRVIVGRAGTDTLYDFGGNVERAGTVSTTSVGPRHLSGWGWVQQSFDAVTGADLPSNQKFVTGPGVAPLGDGSLRFRISDATNPHRVEQLRTPVYDGVLLRDLRQLDYRTFQRAAAGNLTPQQPAYLRLDVDNGGDGTRDTTLFYFPANNGPVLQGAWQAWDADGGAWSIGSDSGPAAAVTLDNYLVAHPDARVANTAGGTPAGGGVTIQVGDGGPGQGNGTYFVDAVRLTKVGAASGRIEAGARFNLEPTHVELALTQGAQHRVRAHVTTRPHAPGATVAIYRVTAAGRTRVLEDVLNENGRITRLLASRYPVGTRLTFLVKVTAGGRTYTSERSRITIG